MARRHNGIKPSSSSLLGDWTSCGMDQGSAGYSRAMLRPGVLQCGVPDSLGTIMKGLSLLLACYGNPSHSCILVMMVFPKTRHPTKQDRDE
jgi:hypothetical protein